MAAIRLFRQRMIRVVMAGRFGRLNMLSSLIGNLASSDGGAPLSFDLDSRQKLKLAINKFICFNVSLWNKC